MDFHFNNGFIFMINTYGTAVLIIGMGNLGTRYLQGLMKSNCIKDIYCIDASNESLALARSRSEDVKDKKYTGKIYFLNKIPENQNYEILINSTCADVRYETTLEAITKNNIRNIILEKVLFQNTDHYENFLKILNENSMSAWINCPRRVSGVYKKIYTQLNKNLPIEISISGGRWGFLCNTIHFNDLFLFLTNKSTISNMEIKKYCKPFESKRANFYEIYGKFTGNIDNHSINIECLDNSKDLIVNIINGDKEYIVNETQGIFINGKNSQSFKFLYQSELTTSVAEKIILDGSSDLPTYRETYITHLNFLRSVQLNLKFFAEFKFDNVPIT